MSDSRNLILKAEKLARVGICVVDGDLKEIGKVMDFFGPVDKPYISVKLNVKDPEKYVGKVLYTLED